VIRIQTYLRGSPPPVKDIRELANYLTTFKYRRRLQQSPLEVAEGIWNKSREADMDVGLAFGGWANGNGVSG